MIEIDFHKTRWEEKRLKTQTDKSYLPLSPSSPNSHSHLLKPLKSSDALKIVWYFISPAISKPDKSQERAGRTGGDVSVRLVCESTMWLH